MQYTGNYNLKKPGGTDIVNIDDLNDNADILDQKLKEVENKADNAPPNSVNDAAIGSRTPDQSQAPASPGTGTLTQLISWLANRIKAVTGKTNWWDAPPTTLQAAKNHIDAAAPHSGHETPSGAQAKVDIHANSKQSHGISSGYYIAKTSRSDQLPAWNDIQGKPDLALAAELDAHLSEIATQDKAGHIKLSDIPLPAIATQAEAETGTNNTKFMTPLRTHQAIDSKVRIVDNMLELNVDGEWQIFKLVPPDDTTDAPGSKWLIDGDMQAGFFGEVSASELISGDELASMIGLSAGTAQFSNEPWLKFAYQGKIQFVAKKPFRYSLSWNDINAANAVYGDRTVTIGGLTYKVRLMRGANKDPAGASNGSICHGSEWNRLMLPIHENAPNNWAYPNNVDSPTEDWGVNYTDEDLLTYDNYGDGSRSWCQEVTEAASDRVSRGYGGVSYSSSGPAVGSSSAFGWRPVLELVE